MTIKNISKVNDLHAELVLILKAITNWKYPALAEPTLKDFFFFLYTPLEKNSCCWSLWSNGGILCGYFFVNKNIHMELFLHAWANMLCHTNDLNTNFSRIILFFRIPILILIALGLIAHFHQWLNYYRLTKRYIKDPPLGYWKNQVRQKLFIPVINRRLRKILRIRIVVPGSSYSIHPTRE